MSARVVSPRYPRMMVGLFAASMAVACGDGSSPTGLRQGSLAVSITTSGGDPDEDGYELVVGGVRRLPVTANDAVILDAVPSGTHVLSLNGVAENCIVSGTHPFSIRVPFAGAAHVSLSVRCEATGLAVTARTIGADYPAGFDIHIADQLPAQFARPNEPLSVTRLPAGRYAVSLSTAAGNCSLRSANPVTVDVVNRAVTPVAFDVTCARTEKRIAFVLDSVAGSVHAPWIVVADSNGSSVVPLTKGYSPAWSPDGKKLVYSDADCGSSYYDYGYCSGGLAIIDPETRGVTIPSNGSLGAIPSWSPDGTLIAFSQISSPFVGLLVARLDGSPAERVGAPRYALHPTWSPDGQRIAFACIFDDILQEICVLNRDGTGLLRLTNDAAVDINPAWSPDGSTIAFATNRFTSGRIEIALMTPSGTDLRRLTSGFDPAWSPDGSKIAFAGGDGLFTIHPDGSNLRRLTTGQHHDPAWRP